THAVDAHQLAQLTGGLARPSRRRLRHITPSFSIEKHSVLLLTIYAFLSHFNLTFELSTTCLPLCGTPPFPSSPGLAPVPSESKAATPQGRRTGEFASTWAGTALGSLMGPLNTKRTPKKSYSTSVLKAWEITQSPSTRGVDRVASFSIVWPLAEDGSGRDLPGGAVTPLHISLLFPVCSASLQDVVSQGLTYG
ncbi:hypothetical protein H4582DRAFT_2006789, partial [Lactarius indigo]